MSTFNLVVDQGDLSVTGDSQQCSKCGYITHHYNDGIMGAIASQITSLTIVYSIVYSDADQRKHQSSASLAFASQMASNAENVSIWWRHNDYGPFCSHAKYDYTKLGHTVVMNIWNEDARQRRTYLIWVDLCNIISVLNKLFYLLVDIMLLLQDSIIHC